jgi:hypothetical protein
MVALTAPRNTPAALGDVRTVPLPANGKVWQGGMVQVTAAGYAASASATAANVTVGRADETVDNTGGANGDKSVKVRRGVFRYANSAAGDLIARTEIGKDCYVVDDQTVAKTSNTGVRPVAGKVFGVDAQGVWVEFA